MSALWSSAVLRTLVLSETRRTALCRRHVHSALHAATDTSGSISSSSSSSINGSNPAAGHAVEPPDVRQLARLAQLEVTDAEVADWAPKIEGILQWFAQLQQVDLEGVPPAVRADVGDGNFLREDEPHEFANRQEMLEQVPQLEGSFVKVPKITTGSDS